MSASERNAEAEERPLRGAKRSNRRFGPVSGFYRELASIIAARARQEVTAVLNPVQFETRGPERCR